MAVYARSLANYQVEIKADQDHIFIADEPVSGGGDDAGPKPYDYLLAGLAGCKIITVQMYAQRKGWPLTGVEVGLVHYKIPASECEDCESEPNAKVDIIQSEISFEGDLTEEQKQRLKEISERCPVHRTLTSETKIYTKMVEKIL